MFLCIIREGLVRACAITVSCFLALCVCPPLLASTVVIEEPVSFSANESIFFKVELINIDQDDEMLKITLEDGSVAYKSTSSGEIINYVNQSGEKATLSPELEEQLKRGGFDTGWFPTPSPFQMRFVFSIESGTVEVAESGKVRIEYDDNEVGPGESVPVKVSWTPGSGDLEMIGGLEVGGYWKITVAGWEEQGSLPYIPSLDLLFWGSHLFPPFLLNGGTSCQDILDAGWYQSVVDLWLVKLSIGANIHGLATGRLYGDKLCGRIDDSTKCITTNSGSFTKTIYLDPSSCNTTTSIIQDYFADFYFDFEVCIVPDGCLYIFPFVDICMSDIIPDNWCLPLEILDSHHVDLDFNTENTPFTIVGKKPTISVANPGSGCGGETVTINGGHFGNSQGTVFFGNSTASISSWNNTHIGAQIPGGSGDGVKVQTVCGTSQTYPFDVYSTPPPPSWCSATDDKCNHIDITWENVSGEAGYRIYREGSPSPIGSTGANQTSYQYNVTGTYSYCVKAYNNCGESNCSPSDDGTGLTPPPQPSYVSPADGATDQLQPVSLDWSDVSGADSCQVQVDSNSDFGSQEMEIDTVTSLSYYEASGLAFGTTYWWRVRAHNGCGWGDWNSGTWDFTTDEPTSVEDIYSPELPDHFVLSQNYPNPFNPETRIEFALPRGSFVTIDIYNIVGRRIRNLANERLSAGRKIVTWDGRDDNGQRVSSGVYFYRIVTDDFTESKKMVLLK